MLSRDSPGQIGPWSLVKNTLARDRPWTTLVMTVHFRFDRLKEPEISRKYLKKSFVRNSSLVEPSKPTQFKKRPTTNPISNWCHTYKQLINQILEHFISTGRLATTQMENESFWMTHLFLGKIPNSMNAENAKCCENNFSFNENKRCRG